MEKEEIITSLGVSEEELDRRAQEYEDDTWDSSHLGKVVMGRPSIADEEVRPITVRLPVSQIAAVDALAKAKSTTRSAVIRSAIGALVSAI